jgi:YidC/Oxa1 family membrane protein insertase
VSILNPLFEAVAWVISRIHDALAVPFGAASGWSWGLSIVLLVMLMRLIMVPLFVKQVRSQRKMQSHMPALQEIRKKYKNDKTRLNEETMKFYKENGINPLGGCLPLVAQLPVFWSLFNVLKAIADWVPGKTPQYGLSVATVTSARTAHVFGVLLSDKFLWATTGESWTVRAVILASVAISATTTFLTMRQSAKRGMMNQQMPDPDQPGAAMAQSMSKNMMYIAPFFALTGLYWQYGLVIYWVTTNVWTLGQQHILFRNLPIVGSATVGASAVGAASGSNRPAVKSTVVKGSVNAAKSNGTATAKSSNGAAKAASKPGTAGRPATASRPATPGRPATASKSATASKPGTAGKPDATGTADTDTDTVPAANASPTKSAANGAKPAANGAKSAVNGAKSAVNSAVNNGTVSSSQAGSTGRGLLGFGKKKPEPEEVPVVPETKIVRQQPVRQARSKRSGNAGNAGKR